MRSSSRTPLSVRWTCLGRHHVVGDNENFDAEFEEPRRDGFHNRGLPGAYRPANADARDLLIRHLTLLMEVLAHK
jgi:hypothetical protein